MATLPGFLQRLLTWLTGKPLAGQAPLFRWTPFTRTLAGLGTLLLGVAANALAVSNGGFFWLLMVPGLLLTSGGLRALYLEIAHNAVHHAYGKTRVIDMLVTELFTTLTLMNGYHVFRRDHVQLHHGRNGTLDDPDYAALLSWGFLPGLPLHVLRRRALLAPINPRIHASYLLARLRANFAMGPLYRRLAALALHGGLLAWVASTGAWSIYGLAWLLPLVAGFQASSVLQMLAGEHRWGLVPAEAAQRMRELTYGRFLGDPWPQVGQLARVGWLIRVLFVHLPARVFVFVGNDIGPAHDVHHRRPNFDWPNAAYAREALRARGELPGAVDVWGSLVGLIDYTLIGMSQRGRQPARLRRAA